MPNVTGPGDYSGPRTGSRASSVLALMRRRIALRSELEVISGQISDVVPQLSQAERAEVIYALSADDVKLDADMSALRIETERVQAEEARAQHARKMQVSLSRAASALVQRKAERRASHGTFMSAEELVTQAICASYGKT